jgi:hypothetical protein
MNKVITALVGLSFFSLVACGAGDSSENETPANATQAANGASFCDTVCKRNAACDNGIDAQTCTSRCENSASTFTKLRSEIVDGIAACYEGSDCRSILTSDRMSACVSEAAVSAAPNAASKSFCAALASSMAKCDDPIDYAKCLGLVKIYSDETLEAAQKCTSKSCSSLGPCIEAELDLGN